MSARYAYEIETKRTWFFDEWVARVKHVTRDGRRVLTPRFRSRSWSEEFAARKARQKLANWLDNRYRYQRTEGGTL